MMRCESSCAILFCIIGCAASADLLAPGVSLMRKDQEGAVTEQSTAKSTISVETDGHLVDERHVRLHRGPFGHPDKAVPAKAVLAKGVPAKAVQAKAVPAKAVQAKAVPAKAVPALPAAAAAAATAYGSGSGNAKADPTSFEQAVTLLPPMTIGCLGIGGLAIVASSMLMYSHFKAGARITGSVHKFHSSSATFIGLLWTVPVFTALGLYGMLLPEMAAPWQFVQALLLTATLRRMPAMFLQVGGGRLQMQRSLQVNGEGEPVHVFSQFPLSFLRRWVPSKVVQNADIDDLQLAVSFACTLLPILSFLEMLCTLEATLPATLTHHSIALSAPGVAFFIRLMEVLLIVLCMSALHGLDVIVHTLSPKASEDLNLKGKSEYCQCFLVGLRLMPILVNIVVFLWNGGALPDNRRVDAFRSFLVCVTSLGCVWMSKLAFPVDEYHYPELKAAAGLEDATLQKKMKTKAVLDTIMFCPFCGSGDLELEPGSTDAASCPACGARQVPINLIVHRDRVSAAPSSTATGSGRQY